MDKRKDLTVLLIIIAVFLACYFLPADSSRLLNAVQQSLLLVQDYAREHVIKCLVPAFFIAGAVAVFLNRSAIVRFLGPGAPKPVAYAVASMSGTILAVCSCTVLPLFSGIYKMGAGLGPATAFLYSGPAINVLAIVLTASVLGPAMGIARAVGAVLFSVVIGLLMHFLFPKNEQPEESENLDRFEDVSQRPVYQTVVYFALMIGILVFANWAKPGEASGLWYTIYSLKWVVTSALAAGLGIVMVIWFGVSLIKIIAGIAVTVFCAVFIENKDVVFAAGMGAFTVIMLTGGAAEKKWVDRSWSFAKQILPLLFIGVVVAGLLLGTPAGEGIIPSRWVNAAVGGNSVRANFFASLAGAFMYFATLTEVPILHGLIGSGMGKGPALALLLAGPALSLPNMLVIRSVLGTKKTLVFVGLVVFMATFSGMIYGAI